jgi:hypothetical protein
MLPARTIAGVVAAMAIVLVGCDDDSGDETTTTTTTAPAPKETFQEVPKLPPGWKVQANRSGGFAFGLPPGWKANNAGPSTRVRSFDRLVAVSIAPDRAPDALGIGVEDFAARAVEALEGFEAPLDPGPARRFEHPYRATEVRADGKAETGVRQQVRVFVLRRGDIVTLTAVMAVNAKPSAHPSEQLAERMLRTLRSRPPGTRGKDDGADGRDGSDGANGRDGPGKRRR